MDGGCAVGPCPGSVNSLRNAFVAADDELANNPPNATKIHESCEALEEFLVNDSTSSAGVADTINTFVEEFEALV
jgi:hypothetical protein